MFERSLTNARHTRRFQIRFSGAAGWLVREEQDSTLVRARVYDDWHRVERARLVFDIEATSLKKAGWVDEPV